MVRRLAATLEMQVRILSATLKLFFDVLICIYALVVKLVNTADLNSAALNGLPSSSLGGSTNIMGHWCNGNMRDCLSRARGSIPLWPA